MTSSVSSRADGQRGVMYAICAYFCWGLFPLYWKPLHAVPAMQILCHRVVWSALFIVLVLSWQRKWTWLGNIVREPRKLGVFVCSSSLLSINWGMYIWAVNQGHVLEASLGYFINPLVNVLLGRVFLAERLNKIQLSAVMLALLGVVWLTLMLGTVPWIAMVLALSFGLYGLLRKQAPLPALEGLAIESFIQFPLAAMALLFFHSQGVGSFGHVGPVLNSLMMGAGVVTAVPLLMFAAGARRLTLTTLGIVQYVSPTLQFLLGVRSPAVPSD